MQELLPARPCCCALSWDVQEASPCIPGEQQQLSRAGGREQHLLPGGASSLPGKAKGRRSPAHSLASWLHRRWVEKAAMKQDAACAEGWPGKQGWN